MDRSSETVKQKEIVISRVTDLLDSK